MRRAPVVLRTALLAALVGLLCLTPAVAMARPPVSGLSATTHHKGWTTSDTHGAAQGRAGTAPILHRTEPRLEHQLEPVSAALPRVVVLHDAATFVGRSTRPVVRVVPRAASCPKMRAPPA